MMAIETIKKTLLLGFSIYSFFSFSQKVNTTKLDQFRCNFFATFFENKCNKDITKKVRIVLYYESTDTMDNPVVYQNSSNSSQLKMKGVEFVVKFKNDLNFSTYEKDTIACFFQYISDVQFERDLDSSKNINQYQIIDSLHETRLKLFSSIEANQIFVLQKNDEKDQKYFLRSKIATCKVIIKISCGDRFFLKQNGYSLDKNKEDALLYLLNTMMVINKEERIKLFECSSWFRQTN
jgi:hypothetical protein